MLGYFYKSVATEDDSNRVKNISNKTVASGGERKKVVKAAPLNTMHLTGVHSAWPLAHW